MDELVLILLDHLNDEHVLDERHDVHDELFGLVLHELLYVQGSHGELLRMELLVLLELYEFHFLLDHNKV